MSCNAPVWDAGWEEDSILHAHWYSDCTYSNQILRRKKTTVGTDHLGLSELHGSHAALRVFLNAQTQMPWKGADLTAFTWGGCHGYGKRVPGGQTHKSVEGRAASNSWVPSQHAADSGLKVCARIKANIHNAFYGISTGYAFFSVIHLTYHDMVSMCTSQTPTLKISLKWKSTPLCVNLFEHEPENFFQRCQSSLLFKPLTGRAVTQQP